MLSLRIIDTIKFFDLQDYPLTAFEVQKYLVSDKSSLQAELDQHYELPVGSSDVVKAVPVHFDTVVQQLNLLVVENQLEQINGFYCLPGKSSLINQRLENYHFGLQRERLIRRYGKFTKHIPFIRGIALAGSQALGLQRATSDIDLLIITDYRFMWLARTFLTAYFHVLKIRRHGSKITNRFCLNHYLAIPREVDAERNLYKAMEYTKLRPIVYPQAIVDFQIANQGWIKKFFPNVDFEQKLIEPQSRIQFWLEKVFLNPVGIWLEKKLGQAQLRRIRQEKYNFVKDDELSFHPGSKHEQLLNGFYESSVNTR